MKKLLGLGIIGVSVTVGILSMLKKEKEDCERAAKILEERKRFKNEKRLENEFRKITEEMKQFHDDIIRRMKIDRD